MAVKAVALVAASAGAAGHANCAGAGGRRCPVRLLSVVGGGGSEDIVLEEDGIRYLEEQRGPLYVVPALGVYRSGKSFLLNRCRGLVAPYEGGFGVGHGQETQTRGVEISAEWVAGLGTVVWMDTEGLFSSESARSSYGPKLFSLALLFSSTVLLNSVKVLSEQFFTYFGAQQQIAVSLRHRLEAANMTEGGLLPKNLNVFWVLQQPVGQGSADSEATQQLASFLAGGANDELRVHVRRGFRHHLYTVPFASYDMQQWASLDMLQEDELNENFKFAAAGLRERVLKELASARPFSPQGAARQLRLFAQLVEGRDLDLELIREAVAEAQLSALCGGFGAKVVERSGPMPAPGLEFQISTAREEVSEASQRAIDSLLLGRAWSQRLAECIDTRAAELRKISDEKVVEDWRRVAQEKAEGANCYFLYELMSDLRAREVVSGRWIDSELRARAVHLAVGLQRTRLVECLRVRHLVNPLVPWILPLVVMSYTQTSVDAGILRLGVHSVIAVGTYGVLQGVGMLPPWLDFDRQVLRARPHLLDRLISILPWMPWDKVGNSFGFLGICFGFWLFASKYFRREVGDWAGGFVNFEMQQKTFLRCAEASLKQKLLSCFEKVQRHVDRDEERSAANTLLRGFQVFRGLRDEDPIFKEIEACLRQRIKSVLSDNRQADVPDRFATAWETSEVLGLALRDEWQLALEAAVSIMERCFVMREQEASARRRSGRASSPVPMAKRFLL
eukprot:TRINITY_DN74420_c0_g1_i1.p1 TRINITY_DN74420_c0_g1~~TRINITY_DN74420_c0_g1_i1.p1  ORF type:complete len:806 (-),score=160.35 TRINITY_DN74420_c0_g1_i1:38-2236(-)